MIDKVELICPGHDVEEHAKFMFFVPALAFLEQIPQLFRAAEKTALVINPRVLIRTNRSLKGGGVI